MTETITISGKKACLNNGSGADHVLNVDQFAARITDNTIQGLDDEPLTDNERWRVKCRKAAVLIIELKPELRWIKWIAPDSPARYGPTATHQERQLATPYVILKVPFHNKRVLPRVEVFYRNAPLGGLDGDDGALFWPNLLNVSPHSYGCTAWFCTQYLRVSAIEPTYAAGLDAVIHHLFGGQFNASSEAHEGASTFSKAVDEKVDPRVTDVDRWESESKANPRFVLTVKWKPTGLTVRDLVEQALKTQGVAPVPDTAAALGNLMLQKKKPR